MGKNEADVLRFPKKSVAKAGVNALNVDINASLAPAEPAMDEDDLRTAVQRIVVYGTYVECTHSSRDRAYRNISDDDIQACLTGPWKLAGFEPSKIKRGWKYTVTGCDIEGDELSLVIDVNKELQRIEIITKF